MVRFLKIEEILSKKTNIKLSPRRIGTRSGPDLP